MIKFRELRTAAGYGDREKFAAEFNLTERTVWSYDNGKAEPSAAIIKLLRMLANGCQFCIYSSRIDKPHRCELPPTTPGEEPPCQ